jgi:hypothetical protein
MVSGPHWGATGGLSASALESKSQITSTKSQTNSKYKIQSTSSPRLVYMPSPTFEFGALSLFGISDLRFEISLPDWQQTASGTQEVPFRF